jgi:hypothetical protein
VFREEWQAAAENVVRPKLLVVLEGPAVVDPFSAKRPIAQAELLAKETVRYEELQSEIHRLAAQGGVGPTLWVPVADREAALKEITAAIEAMA